MIDHDITQSNVKDTLCITGYTKYVLREETGEMIKVKKRMMAANGLDYKTEKRNWQLDHILPLILGGEATHPDNLQLQKIHGDDGAKHKDAIEKKLGRMVCDGDIALAQAQREIVSDWQAAAAKYLKPRRVMK
jgi:hypothetical protein